ncbi:MAG TPA: serine/threonine-protein kinase [Gemmataceae bacterium]|nr:serine/threonine-protein kinase [Gemmataceae bacterium]
MATTTLAAPPRTPFLDAVNKSGLIAPERLAEILSQFDPRQVAAADPIQLATFLVRRKLLTKFQAMHLLNGRTQGFLLGRYRVLDGLREDRVGMVFLAEHEDTKQPAAIKVLPTDRVADPAVYQAFLAEAEAASRADHPNIARVLAVGTWNDTHYVAVEHVSAPTLDKVVADHGPLPPHSAAQVVAQVAIGLMHVHEQGQIHRDLKPANIAVLPDNRVKVLDLGLTRMIDNPYANSTQRFNLKEYAEEIAHIPPEQATRDGLDARSDIYSLGSTLYYLLTGENPFPGLAMQAMADKRSRDVPPPSEVQPEVPPELDDLVQQMGAKDPDERFQSAAELVVALRPWLPVWDWITLDIKPAKSRSRVRAPGRRATLQPTAAPEPAEHRRSFGPIGAFFGRLFGR